MPSRRLGLRSRRRHKSQSPGHGGLRAGAGRPAREPCRTKAYYLPVRLIEKLAKKAASEGVPASTVIARWLERMLD